MVRLNLKEWRIIVGLNANGLCEICGRPGDDAHHVIRRRFKSIITLPANGLWLCRECHIWVHNNPLKFKEWFFKHKGEDLYYHLKKLSQRRS